MGFNTEYLGHLEITPHLNAAEAQWLSGFADWGGLPDGDPFTLPMNPRAELAAAFDRTGGSMSRQGRIPYGVHDWRVCEHGDRISWQRGEKSNDAVATLRFLVSHYLGPGASAQQSGNPDFVDFTFDHRLDGVIAGVRDDTEELFLLRVVDSEITRGTVVPGVEPWMTAVLDTTW